MSTKLNVNVRTLLTNCEQLAKDETNFWRLKKYIKSLDTMIEELRDIEAGQSTSKIPEYEKRLNAIKDTTKYVEISPTSAANNKRINFNISRDNTANDALNEIRQIDQSKQYTDLRKELLNDDSLRRRRQRRPDESGEAGGGAAGSEGMNEAVKYYNQAQEKITEHMLALTRSLKEQTETANRIIKKDTEVVSKSTGITENNITSLHKETEKLEDHSRNAWKCWMWMMIVFVLITFIGMVLFMKIMKKRKV